MCAIDSATCQVTVCASAVESTLAEVKCPHAHCTPLSIHSTAGPPNTQYAGCTAVTTPCWGMTARAVVSISGYLEKDGARCLWEYSLLTSKPLDALGILLCSTHSEPRRQQGAGSRHCVHFYRSWVKRDKHIDWRHVLYVSLIAAQPSTWTYSIGPLLHISAKGWLLQDIPDPKSLQESFM